jgi:hypothetical protein
MYESSNPPIYILCCTEGGGGVLGKPFRYILCNKNKYRVQHFLLFLESAPATTPGKANACHIERRKTKREGREVAITAVIAEVGVEQILTTAKVGSFTIIVPWNFGTFNRGTVPTGPVLRKLITLYFKVAFLFYDFSSLEMGPSVQYCRTSL